MKLLSCSLRSVLMFVACGGVVGFSASADIETTPTVDPAVLAGALNARGLTVNSVIIRKGQPGQIGTYRGFNQDPVTIRDGIVLSSGDVSNIGPQPEMTDPAYDPAGPPAAVNSAMDPNGTGGTPEFDAYGAPHNNIHNFDASYDVAAIEVRFTLPEDSQIQFDFIFGSVEFPFYTSDFTDAFLVFLDGTAESNQITFDAAGDPVQVGRSFANLETTADQNTAFSSPHAVIHHLTTTSERLDAGEHVLIFEVGDVNDQILDSVAFITNLRAGTGDVGTDPSDDCHADYNSSGDITVQDIFDFLAGYFDIEPDADFNGSGTLTVQDIFDFLAAYFAGCQF